jgi:hypothetical protein
MPFQNATRHMLGQITQSKTKGTENPLQFVLRKVGILTGVYIDIQGNITSGGLSGLNAGGKAAIIKKVELKVNGVTIFSISGVGYHYGLREFVDNYFDPGVGTDARSAVATGNYNISMFLPVSVNARDQTGLLILNTDRSEVAVTVEFESDANVATGITTHTATVKVYPELFSLPADPKDWPEFSMLHGVIEETKAIAANGDMEPYRLQHGNVYLGAYFLYGVGATPVDNWSQFILQSGNEIIYKMDPSLTDYVFWRNHGRARVKGLIPIDLLGTSGLGTYGSDRDVIFSQALADLQMIITASASPGTLYILRRELIQVKRSN